MPGRPVPNLLNDALADEVNSDFEIMRMTREKTRREHPPSAEQTAAFQQSCNEFINHRRRPFSPMRETNMLL
jgi:hypothetical protein